MGSDRIFSATVGRLERFLRLDGADGEPLGTAALMRARLTYGVAFMFIAVQILNWFSLFQSYGGWHLQHLVSLGACVGLMAMVCLLRVWRSPWIYGTIYGALIIMAVVAANVVVAHPLLGGGINTSLLPLLVMGAVIIGLVSSWREVIVFTLAAFALMLGLYGYSHAQVGAVDWTALGALATAEGFTAQQSFILNHNQRLFQGALALFVTGATSAGFSYKLYGAFDELDAAVAEARRATEAKGDFLAQMSHEIRTPLNGIVAMSDLLAGGDLPDHAQKPAEIVATASQQLVTIIDDILDSARLEAGRVEIVEEPFDLRAEMAGLMELHRQSATDKGLWLGLAWQDGLPARYRGDGGRIRQVVGNFVSNGLKFTKAGGVRVTVRGREKNGRATLSIVVQDTGVGIAPGEVEGVFERYRQSDSGRRQGSKGTGLGLAIAKDLAELMGGSVGVHSLYGQGTAFHLTLDLAVVPEKPVTAPRVEPRAA